MTAFVVIENLLVSDAVTAETHTASPTIFGGGLLSAAFVNNSEPPLDPQGVLTATWVRNEPNILVLQVLDKSLIRAPTSVQVVLTGAEPGEPVSFKIDGTVRRTADADSQGNVGPLSIPVKQSYNAGTHTVRAEQAGALSAEDTFTLRLNGQRYTTVPVQDTDPVAIPGTVQHGTRHFVLQDLKPSGLGSYIFPINPREMTSPHGRRELTAQHTSSVQEGQFHVFEGGPLPTEWKLSGFCPDKAMHDKLVAYCALRRRLWVIDHRNRAWKCAMQDFEPSFRRRTNFNGTVTDWANDYVLTILVLDENWKRPA